MDETEWDIQEVKRLKKKQLIQYNFGMLFLFLLFAYYVKTGGTFLAFLILCCVFFWIMAAHTLYTLKTGKMIGTKTNRLVQAFDRDHRGERRWKRKTMTEAVIISMISVIFTVLLFMINFDSVKLDFPSDTFPLIGGWLGFNIGEIVRMNNL
ncbi:hypothetical protein M948_21030 [Virgibacillus sp. CM-4]|uniref:Uncharacterized protein n=1 Tax=Virgibacillus massiliensis TaxID=1462526 RepID=A0A024QFP4_9BACI|nr:MULTISPECIES: hypothetical protein [Virgibacillus]EQB34547.1 hypothetical protein M948_21030 [Virgibacillus sp. CM-4]CDQ41373.1 hypothetical protein BN990_03743 [Virgibacillus massiliensis]